MVNFLIKKIVGAVFTIMICYVIIAQSGVLNSLAGLGIHIGISDIIHPDRLIDSSLQNFEQNLNAQIN